MNNLLTKLLNKRKIESINDLDPEEKKTFEGWQEILQKDELNVEDIKNFCKMQIEILENRWADYGISNEKKAELIPYHTIWQLLLKAIESPKQGKVALEKNLEQLLKQ